MDPTFINNYTRTLTCFPSFTFIFLFLASSSLHFLFHHHFLSFLFLLLSLVTLLLSNSPSHHQYCAISGSRCHCLLPAATTDTNAKRSENLYHSWIVSFSVSPSSLSSTSIDLHSTFRWRLTSSDLQSMFEEITNFKRCWFEGIGQVYPRVQWS